MPVVADDIHNRAYALFKDWGDWPGLAQALKQVPTESPPGQPDDDIATIVLPPPKGPVVQNNLVVMDVRPSVSTLETTRSVTLLDAPADGNAIATLLAGTELDLIETLPHGIWLRVFATVDGILRQGYVPASSLQR